MHFDPVKRCLTFSSAASSPAASISLDSPGSGPVFISHAHADHAVKSAGEIFSSVETLTLLKARNYAKKTAVHKLEVQLPETKLKLLDAGHVLGSRQLLAENSSTFLYTGDVKLTNSLTAGAGEIVQCDELFIETTYGSPEYVFPSRIEVGEQIARWVKANQRRGEISVLGGYALGKAQEIIAALNSAGLTPVVSGDVEKISQIYKEMGVKLDFISATSEEGKKEIGGAFATVLPLGKVNTELSYVLKQAYGRGVKMAACSGWALTTRFAGMEGFPLSDHADHRELMEIVERSSAKKVYCAYGFSEEFATELRRRGKNTVAIRDTKARKKGEHSQQTLKASRP